ncbi:MAG TPA: site-specific integrase [Mucilaginibacter sp.]|jgi:site-specific recombinase XerD
MKKNTFTTLLSKEIQNYSRRNPFLKYKPKEKEITLMPKNLWLWHRKSWSPTELRKSGIFFFLSCYTGLAYADVKKLRRSEIFTGLDGQQWIFTNRQKTDTASRIPLLPQALKLLAQYQDHPQCTDNGLLLPVLSNQKMNSYLKEIADAYGITKELTYHIARHTFATTVILANGVSIESVSKMLGHTNIKTTQHYAKILDAKVSEDTNQLKKNIYF